jgi:hypothetical protein
MEDGATVTGTGSDGTAKLSKNKKKGAMKQRVKE